MTVLQQAQLYVDQLRREASKQRITVSEAITDMKVSYNGISRRRIYRGAVNLFFNGR